MLLYKCVCASVIRTSIIKTDVIRANASKTKVSEPKFFFNLTPSWLIALEVEGVKLFKGLEAVVLLRVDV